jgi:CheY-like chemotaxis protein
LKRASGLGEGDRGHVAEALEAATHAASLTRQLLAFGRRQAMAPKVFDLNAVLGAMEDMLRRIVGEHVDVSLALVDEPCPIDSDPVQIEQVILNLAINARHAMPEGGALRISTSSTVLREAEAHAYETKAGTFVVLTVSDSGTGMSEETMAHLFEPFFSTKPQGEGTGLGLATVYGVVKQSGGHVLVRSELGKGTTFELLFPRAEDEEEIPPASFRPASVDDAILDELRGKGERVLVVEDAAGMRQLVVDVLDRAGYVVLAATDGEDALRLLRDRESAIALVVSDVVMPKMGGRTLAARIREIRPDVRILLMSGHETAVEAKRRESERSERSEPPIPRIEKPFTEELLLSRIRETLRR